MKKSVAIGATLVISIAVLVLLLPKFNQKPKEVSQTDSQSLNQQKVQNLMKISSSAFQHNQNIPSKYTCDGENINPPLSFSDVPSNAKSLVLIMDDPDASSKTWVHWTVFNIDPGVTELSEGSIPQGGLEAMTDFGKPGYGGSCPPGGTHRYFFKVYALDTVFTFSSTATKEELEKAMEGHILDKAELIGLYSSGK